MGDKIRYFGLNFVLRYEVYILLIIFTKICMVQILDCVFKSACVNFARLFIRDFYDVYIYILLIIFAKNCLIQIFPCVNFARLFIRVSFLFRDFSAVAKIAKLNLAEFFLFNFPYVSMIPDDGEAQIKNIENCFIMVEQQL